MKIFHDFKWSYYYYRYLQVEALILLCKGSKRRKSEHYHMNWYVIPLVLLTMVISDGGESLIDRKKLYSDYRE